MKAPSRSFGRDFDLRDLVLDDFAHQAGGDLAALRHHRFAGLVVDGVRQLQADEIVVDLPLQLRVFDMDLADAIERPQNLLVGFETERAQENRTVKLAFAVDADIKQVLVVVLELDPASAIRNDLAEDSSPAPERARRTRRANGATG